MDIRFVFCDKVIFELSILLWFIKEALLSPFILINLLLTTDHSLWYILTRYLYYFKGCHLYMWQMNLYGLFWYALMFGIIYLTIPKIKKLTLDDYN